MDNYNSGSIVEPRITPALPQTAKIKRQKLIFIITIVIEAIIILCLAIGLILTIYNQEAGWAGTEDEGWLEEEELYAPTSDEATALMYIYSTANDAQVKNKSIPASFCEILRNVFNSATKDDTKMVASPCVDSKITVLKMSSVSEDLASVGEIYIGIVSNDNVYSYYISTDFSYIGSVDENDNTSTDVVILNVDNS